MANKWKHLMTDMKFKFPEDIKVGFVDIETLPAVFACWGTGKQFVGYKSLFKEWRISCAVIKTLGKKKLHSKQLDWSKFSYDLREIDDESDKELCKWLVDTLGDYDLLIAHNGKSFDIRRINGRLFRYGLPKLPLISIEDTCTQLKPYVHLLSYSLDYISSLAGVSGKLDAPYDLWMNTMKGSKTALNKKETYCKNDVFPMLEGVWKYVRPYLKSKFNVAAFNGETGCANCGSTNIRPNGSVSRGKTKYKKFKCGSCKQYAGCMSMVSWDKLQRTGKTNVKLNAD